MKKETQEVSSSDRKMPRAKRMLIRNRYLKKTLKALSDWIRKENLSVTWYLKDKIETLISKAYLNKTQMGKLINSKSFQKTFISFINDEGIRNDPSIYRDVKQFYANLLKDLIVT